MKYNKEKYFNKLLSYLMYTGTDIQRNNQIRCPNSSAHKNNDNNYSAHYYERSKRGRPIVKCFSCGLNADIYDIAGLLHGTRDFVEQYKIVDKIFGSGEIEVEEKFSQSGGKAREYNDEPVKYVAVSRHGASGIFNRDAINECTKKSKFDVIKYGEINGYWFYNNSIGNVIALDVRFELEGKKTVQTFWYDGQQVRSYGKINIIYNLYYAMQNKEKPILIHEGAKCAGIGHEKLTAFCNVAYNRGVENADKPDWSVFEGRTVYYLPDNDDPGMKGAVKVWGCLPGLIILDGIYNHFGVGSKGADIEDLIDAGVSVGDIEDYIFGCGIKGV